MITNFENYTFELNNYEKDILLPKIIQGLCVRHGKNKAISNKQACNKMRQMGLKISPARFRKIIQYIRLNGLIQNLLASSKGYYISTNKIEREKYINSLNERINSLQNTMYALTYQNENSKSC